MVAGVEVVGFEQPGAQPEGRLEEVPGLIGLSSMREGHAPRHMSYRQLGIELESLGAGLQRSIPVLRGPTGVGIQKRAAVGNTGIGKSILIVELDSPGEHLQRKLDAATVILREIASPPQIELVRPDHLCRRFLESPLLLTGRLYTEGLHHAVDQLASRSRTRAGAPRRNVPTRPRALWPHRSAGP